MMKRTLISAMLRMGAAIAPPVVSGMGYRRPEGVHRVAKLKHGIGGHARVDGAVTGRGHAKTCTAAEQKRRSRKRRNQLRHKAHLRRKG